MEYLNIKENWNKIKPYTETEEGRKIWKRDLEKEYIDFRVYGYNREFKRIDEEWFNRIAHIKFNPVKPCDLDFYNWRLETENLHEFMNYAVAGRNFWMVNFNLYIARNAFPNKEWRIIRSINYACVWDGGDLLFDLNGFALIPNVEDHPFYKGIPDLGCAFDIGEELDLCVPDLAVSVVKAYDKGRIPLCDVDHWFFSFERVKTTPLNSDEVNAQLLGEVNEKHNEIYQKVRGIAA